MPSTFAFHWLGFDCGSHSLGLGDLSGFIHLGVTVCLGLAFQSVGLLGLTILGRLLLSKYVTLQYAAAGLFADFVKFS